MTAFAIIWIVVTLTFSAGIAFPIWRPWLASMRAKRAVLSDEAQLLIGLIERDEGWVRDRHVWFHPAGICIWVANGRRYLTVNWAAKTRDDWITKDKGGTVMPGADGDAVWAAIENTISRSSHDVHRKDVFEVARAIERLYGDEVAR